MSAELQTMVIGVLANVLSDQVLIMILTGAVHLYGRRFCTALVAPDGAMATPGDDTLLPDDAAN